MPDCRAKLMASVPSMRPAPTGAASSSRGAQARHVSIFTDHHDSPWKRVILSPFHPLLSPFKLIMTPHRYTLIHDAVLLLGPPCPPSITLFFIIFQGKQADPVCWGPYVEARSGYIKMPFAPAMPLLGLSSSDTLACVGNSVCTRLFIVNAKDWKAPKCRPTGDQLTAVWESFGGCSAAKKSMRLLPLHGNGKTHRLSVGCAVPGRKEQTLPHTCQDVQGAESWEGTRVAGGQRQRHFSLYTCHLLNFELKFLPLLGGHL